MFRSVCSDRPQDTIFKKLSAELVMVLKISKYCHLDDIPKIYLVFQRYSRYQIYIALFS